MPTIALRRAEVIIAALLLVVTAIAAGVSVQACRQAESQKSAAERSAAAAEAEAAAANEHNDLLRQASRPQIVQQYFLSVAPSYELAEDKDDVWFLHPSDTMALRAPPRQLTLDWREKQDDQYFIWLSLENIGAGAATDLSIAIDGLVTITFLDEGLLEHRGTTSPYESSLDYDAAIPTGGRLVLLVGSVQQVPSSVTKLEVIQLIEDTLTVNCIITGSLSFSAILAPEPEVTSICPNPPVAGEITDLDDGV